MNKKINVLVFPCGSENSLEIHTALKDVVNVNLFGVSGKYDHGEYIYENYIGNFPYISEDCFIRTLNETIIKFNIDIIFPTHDDVVLKLAENIDVIKSKIAVPSLRAAQLSRSKKQTFNLFKDCRFCPIVYTTYNEIINNLPVFIKPDKGQGGKGALLLKEENSHTINSYMNEEYVICEYLPGEELTVDCFSDFNGNLRFVGPRTRERIFGGISMRSTIIPLSEEIRAIAETINKKVKINGLWFFQLKKDKKGQYKLMEMSVRTAGTMNLYRGIGINFPLLTVYNALGYEVDIIKNDFSLQVDRALFNRYKPSFDYKTVYIDFDDTIVTPEGKIINEVISFLYQAKNEKKKIVLITRHEKNIREHLNNL